MMDDSARRVMIRAAMKAPYLERAEEHELALRWKDHRDQQALHRITTAHMRLVISMAAKFRHFGLSMGDLHFSQGDGEITFCGAIEMAGWVHMKVTLIKGGMAKYGIKNPIFKPSPITPTYNDYLIFEGISVDESGKQYYLDVNVAYRQACLNAIEYLKKFGYSGAQAYSILGTAPVQGHISGVVDVPNACATLWLPTQIFDFDINPSAAGPIKHLDGSVAMPLSPDLV